MTALEVKTVSEQHPEIIESEIIVEGDVNPDELAGDHEDDDPEPA